MQYKEFENIARAVSALLQDIPTHWDGKKAILEMKDNGSKQWRQMEWIGFYFEFLCKQFLSSGSAKIDFAVKDEKSHYGSTQFDGFYKIPWDYKAHAINTSSHRVVINDRHAIESAIQDYGVLGVIMAMGEVEYNDKQRSFQKWHSKLKGGKSEYEKDNKKRGAWSRLRKTQFTLQQISFIKIDKNLLAECGSFQTGFRNADGKPRKEKVLLNLEKLQDNNFYSIDF